MPEEWRDPRRRAAKEASRESELREWLAIMEIAHELGIPTTATMMFGQGEKLIHRLQHFEEIRALQERTAGSYLSSRGISSRTTLRSGRVLPNRMEGAEYLRWLAISRLYLDNVPNLQVSWLTQGSR
jgi:cyclic dehypoxanthinyl futalosine synthase